MQNSKLYSILEYFNKYEQNRLRKFLVSPYFNKNESLVRLFDLVTDHINKQNGTEITKEGLWENIYPKTDYDDVLFRKNSSDLIKLIESYLAQQVFEENPIHKATYLMEAVSRKKLIKLQNSTIRTARRLSNQQIVRPASYYYYQYQVERNYYELSQAELDRSAKTNVEDIAKNLDIFFLGEKLRLACAMLNQQYLISHEYKLLFIDEIVSHIRTYDFDEIPPIAVYYQIYLTIVESDNTEHYFKLKKLLTKFAAIFPQDEAITIYHSAINYCIRKVNQGDQEFLAELFDIYNELINSDLIFRDSSLSPWDFKNVVSCALRLGKYDWTEKFIKSYEHMLPPDFRQNAVSFNLAQLYFHKKEYDNVIEILQQVEYEDFSYNLNSKSFLLVAYYEQDEIEALYSLLESFRTYLNRHKDFPTQRRNMYYSLIKLTKKLCKIMPGDSKSIEKLKSEVETNKDSMGYNWLMEKLAQLE